MAWGDERTHAIHTAKSQIFNLDNGAGTTVDDVIAMPAHDFKLLAARIVYVGATTGTVAAGNAKIGNTIGGAEYVAATAYGDTKAVATRTALTLTAAAATRQVANTPITVRHTGVAATAAGEAFVEVDYEIVAY